MPRVVPSIVVDAIERFFPQVKDDSRYTKFDIDYQTLSALESIHGLALEIPDHLITLSGEDYSDYLIGLSYLKSDIQKCRNFSPGQLRGKGPDYVSGQEKQVTGLDLIYQALKQCPDSAPEPSTSGFEFIEDEDFRFDLRNDLSSANSSFDNGEWKAATVLAGSVIEALLLWRLRNETPESIQQFVQTQQKNNQNRLGRGLEHWYLEDLLNLSEQQNLISVDSQKQCRLAQGFRNLIHPGKSVRTGTKCDRATASIMRAGVELLIREFS
jgi:hypothetical protein